MTISVGERLPDAVFRIKTADGVVEKSTADIFAGRKVVLFAVPGAFTPTCHANHLPGYLEQADAIRDKGVDEIAVVAVNDHHVMGAWEKATGADGKILFLADGAGLFTKAVGLDIDLGAAGLGVRSKRYAMIVEDGVVKALNIEEAPGVSVSGAAAILGLL
ncbi:peroxiredoxin [Kaistia geumhonensis]|uniref:Glutathione-dependent peroxiredoxin n=1 Tax=Kaistia geumhonensis TaxID=410839 RepID=A0ABU0MBC6_9HYPH|nr:peroxiredoxin [Kaistia geumhonensis]MCX5481190.1 peroxiredoxin [Kaistia geumhonensis]MDQ0518251.1 peroxiredoxin [Kaistia geumhonensis]